MCFGNNLLVQIQPMIEETETNNLSMGIPSGKNAVCLTHVLRLFQSLVNAASNELSVKTILRSLSNVMFVKASPFAVQLLELDLEEQV
jgi:hypothetical protein